MLELKLIMYGALPLRMPRGRVMIACGDDIELFDSFDQGIDLALQDGIVALAHPSSCAIGTTHGVFALAQTTTTTATTSALTAVRRFLHKPTIAAQRAAGCLVADDTVFTDSAYAMDAAAAMRLVHFLDEDCGGALNCEIDAYGDVLQALGIDAAADAYVSDTANVVAASSDLIASRRALFHRLRGTPLTALVLARSVCARERPDGMAAMALTATRAGSITLARSPSTDIICAAMPCLPRDCRCRR